MKNLIPVLLFLFINFIYSQEPEELFSTALLTHIKNYKIQTEDAFENGELERGRSLFDTLVNQHLKGTRFDNFKFKNFDDDSYFRTNQIDKPFILITSASWCVVPDDQIAAINLLADEHADEIQIVILYWDKVNKILDLSLQYSENIPVVYFDETTNRDPKTTEVLKHSLGLPVCFYIDKNKKVVDITRGGVFLPYGTKEDLYSINYNIFKNSLDNLIASSASSPNISSE